MRRRKEKDEKDVPLLLSNRNRAVYPQPTEAQ